MKLKSLIGARVVDIVESRDNAIIKFDNNLYLIAEDSEYDQTDFELITEEEAKAIIVDIEKEKKQEAK